MTALPKANVIDMYHGDNNEALPDFAALKAAGIEAIIHKATQGSDYVDPLCASRLQAANDAGLLIACYHFGDGSPVAAQFHNYLKTAQLIPGLDFGILDFERNPSGATMQSFQAAQFLASLVELKIAPVLYGSDLPREAKFKSMAIVQNAWLWLAEYGPVESIPAPWTAATTLGWQFSDTGAEPGIKGDVDLNYFPGDLISQWGKPCSTAS